jgi:hypothetical protein
MLGLTRELWRATIDVFKNNPRAVWLLALIDDPVWKEDNCGHLWNRSSAFVVAGVYRNK